MNQERCECHDCTQVRARERDSLQQYAPTPTFYTNLAACTAPCCKQGYIGYTGTCLCNHGRATL
jgi:hypothetical protein